MRTIRLSALIAVIFLAGSPVRLVANETEIAGGTIPYHDVTPRGTQPGLTYSLLGTAECSGCHAGESHYPYTSFSGSMMANSLRDPLFWAALDIANADGVANGVPNIGDFCLRCHTPNGWYAGRVSKQTDVTVVSGEVNASDIVDGTDGCLLQGDFDNSDVAGNDYQGIGCQFCHRIREDADPGSTQNANVTLDESDCGGFGEPCRAGPYTYPAPGFSAPPHSWEQLDFMSDSQFCGSCHDVTSPMVDDGTTMTAFKTLIIDNQTPSGLDTGLPYPAERTYTEWKNSDFGDLVFRDGTEQGGDAIVGSQIAKGATCQDCHMPQAEPEMPEDPLQACSFGPDRAGDLAVHRFVGANAWVPQILKGEYPNLGRSQAFDQTTSWATELLQNNTASLETTVNLATDLTMLTAQVKVINRAGHKLPTGYSEGRRMWLEVTVRDGNSAVIWSDGTWDPGTGDLTIADHDSIYEIKQGIWSDGECVTENKSGKEQFHFVLNNCIAKDNRIPPIGFTGLDNHEIRPYAASYPETFPGSGRAVNFDVREYAIPLPNDVVTPVSVDVRLRMQIASKEYVEFLRDESIANSTPSENDMCTGGPGRPFVVGPQEKTRGQFLFDLWNNVQYGKSPPVDVALSSVSSVSE